MANEKNLTKMGKNRGLTTEEAQRIGSKGGKASAESKRKKKSMQELAKIIAASPVTTSKQKKALTAVGVPDEDMTQDALVTAALLSQALKGDVKAIAMWQELTSEETDNRIEALKELLGHIGTIS